jgi:hypothetical protein
VGTVDRRTQDAAEPADATGRDRVITIVEASLLAAVALLAAWSGYASAKWSTESRLVLAKAAAARSDASRATGDAAETVNFDASTFNAWFTAYTLDNEDAMAIAERRFRPEFRVAFDAWQAASPATNPDAPPGPTYMPEYQRPNLDKARTLDAEAAARYEEGAEAGQRADNYVRTTIFLATVLFLVGISRHFPLRTARYGLISVSIVILITAIVFLALAPKPPA